MGPPAALFNISLVRFLNLMPWIDSFGRAIASNRTNSHPTEPSASPPQKSKTNPELKFVKLSKSSHSFFR